MKVYNESMTDVKEELIVFSISHAIAAAVPIILLYVLASYSVRHRWHYKAPINPLKIIADSSRRASLSSIQVFFFTFIVVWLVVYWAIQVKELVAIHPTVLGLLGIAIVGSGTGKAVDAARFRVTVDNWAWAKKKGWIKNDFTQVSSEHVPKFSDLLTTDQGFDIARFQAVAFSLVVGIFLLYSGATAESSVAFSNIKIDGVYLGIIGVSQGAYVGGKYAGANLFAELNKKLDKVRSLEIAFTTAVINSDPWNDTAKSERNMEIAREDCAPGEYAEYIIAATEASEIVGSMTGNLVDITRIQPELPLAI